MKTAISQRSRGTAELKLLSAIAERKNSASSSLMSRRHLACEVDASAGSCLPGRLLGHLLDFRLDVEKRSCNRFANDLAAVRRRVNHKPGRTKTVSPARTACIIYALRFKVSQVEEAHNCFSIRAAQMQIYANPWPKTKQHPHRTRLLSFWPATGLHR